jgi:single-strand DNA-binding protein
MYLNNVTLTGFLGADAETRTSKNNTNFTVFSVATKRSWKDRESGEWSSRTDWHRAVVFGRRLSDFAASLKKGDYVQIQGQLRSREYEKSSDRKKNATVPQRVTEIRVSSIVKLDRGTQNVPLEACAS